VLRRDLSRDQAPARRFPGTARAGNPVSTSTETSWAKRIDLRDEFVLPDYVTPRSRSIPLEEACHRVTPGSVPPDSVAAFHSAAVCVATQIWSLYPLAEIGLKTGPKEH
jgi:hypothetical protein